jgi:3-hydroxybutyryl-CoA dehydratase
MMFVTGDRYQEMFTVSNEVYQGFIGLFNDRNPLHTDEAFARGKGFTGKVMHGNILGGFLSYFIGESLPDKNVIIHSQEIQYKQPVYLGDVLEFHAVVTDVHHSVNVVEFKFEFRNAAPRVVAKGKVQIGILS